MHETSSAARRAAPDGGHRLPHCGKTGTPPHQGREVFGDALDAQPHGNPDKGGGNHPELPCNRSGGGRVLLIATEAGNEEQSGPRRKCMGTNSNLTRPCRSVPICQHALGNSRGQPVGGVSRLLRAIQQADPNRPDHHLSLGTGPRLVLNTVQGIAHRGLTDLSGIRNLGVGQTPAEQAQ